MVVVFKYNGVNYSIINDERKTARVGIFEKFEREETNAVSRSFSGSFNIPQFVYKDAIKYEVTEIGYYSCYCCTKITAVFLPLSISIIRSGAFDWCTGVKTFEFPKGSKLEILETCSLCRLYSLSSFVLPPSLKTIEVSAIACHETLKHLYYCGSN